VTNPYSNKYNGFHITFFEKLDGEENFRWPKLRERERWDIGRLYRKPREDAGNNEEHDEEDLLFRQSSFTVSPLSLAECKQVILTRQMLATAAHVKDAQLEGQFTVDNYWTILLLSPSGFFTGPQRHPSGVSRGPHSQQIPDIDWEKVTQRKSEEMAELACIVYALKEVEKRWTFLDKYIGDLLSENFMNPEDYVKLLFDDEIFSRSRLYFWVIGCLNEFDISIGDNIKQWKLFRQARVSSRLESLEPSQSRKSRTGAENGEGPHRASTSDSTPGVNGIKLGLLRDLDRQANEVCLSLENLQSQLRNKSNTARALRDGLFNASALVESRSSTRLGQNVQRINITLLLSFYSRSSQLDRPTAYIQGGR